MGLPNQASMGQRRKSVNDRKLDGKEKFFLLAKFAWVIFCLFVFTSTLEEVGSNTRIVLSTMESG